jgi:uncharacterized protein
MVDPQLLEILVCPETKQPLREADSALLGRINAAIAKGSLKNRAGEAVKDSVDGALVRQDQKYLYPVREGIPIMLIDEAILLADVP